MQRFPDWILPKAVVATLTLAFWTSIPLRAEDPVAAVTSDEASGPQEGKTEYRLVYRFRPDQLLHFDESHRVRMEVRKGDVSQTTATFTHTRKHLRVVSVAQDGTAVLEPVIDHVRMRVRFDDAAPVDFDSDDPEGAPHQFQLVKQTVGKPLARLKFSPRGELLSIEKQAADDDGGDDRRDDSGKPAENAEKLRPDENILVLMPGEPVRVGDTWKERYDVPVQVDRNVERNATLQREYRLLKVEGSVATIGVRIAIISAISDAAILGQLIQKTPTGTVEFDMEQGLILSRAMDLQRTVYGALGPQSTMQAASEWIEKHVPAGRTADAESSSNPAGS